MEHDEVMGNSGKAKSLSHVYLTLRLALLRHVKSFLVYLPLRVLASSDVFMFQPQ